MSTAAAWGWTGAMSRAGRECFRRVMAGTSSGPGWRGGAARKNQFPNRDRLGVTTLKSGAARGPSLVSGSGPPKTGRPLPSAADHSAGCFCRHRRNEFRDRFAPGAALLPAQAARVQGAPDRERADPGQSVRSLAQGFLQQAQRPRRRAVLLALGRAGPFGQDALLRISAIADPWSAPMAGPHGGEPVAVEAADPGGDRLGVPSSDLVGGRRVARAIRNGHERSGALDVRGGGAERAAQAGQLLALLRRERAKGVFPVA